MHARNRIASTWVVAALAVVSAGAGGGASAQGIPMGKSQFFPSLTVQMGSNNNIFNRADIPEAGLIQVQDRYARLEAPLLWVLPFRQSSWEFGYTPGYNLYQDATDLDGWTHAVETELELNFSNGTRLTLGAGARDDYLNTEFAGGELAFNQARYLRTRTLLQYTQPFRGRHALRVQADSDILEFDELASAFSDYDFRNYSAAYLHLVSDTLTLFVEGIYADNFQERQFETEEQQWSRQGAYLKVEKEFNDQDAARFSVGYEWLRFQDSDDTEFSGVLGEVLYRRRLSNSFGLQAGLGRHVNASNFDVNNYFVRNVASVGGEYRPVMRVFFPFVLSYQENAYPDKTLLALPLGTQRRDQIFSGQAGIGFQFARTASMLLSYEYLQRDSNMPQFAYDTRVVSLGFRFGWTPNKDNI